MKAAWRLLGSMSICLALALTSTAQEPAMRDEIHELRREVVELKQLVEELTRRLEGVEYQRLPLLEQPGNSLARPSGTNANSGEPLWLPVEDKSKLRFPYNIERGSSAPVNRIVPRGFKR